MSPTDHAGNGRATPEQAGLLMLPSALATAPMMPVIGQILQHGVRPNIALQKAWNSLDGLVTVDTLYFDGPSEQGKRPGEPGRHVPSLY